MTKELNVDRTGRVALPAEVRRRLEAEPRLKLRIKDLPDGNFLLEIGYDPLEWKGIIKDRGVRLSVEEIIAAVKQRGNRT
ncbi:MAG: hypothetical protein FJY67_05560 [Calditrichaeota bacterium]|nr:hypothetical protein [Calditrichota bacterium]